MSQIMVEAFAKGLVDKIMLEAFEVLDGNDGNGGLRETSHRMDAAVVESQQTRTRFQIRVDHDAREAAELIKNMVRGLRDVRIGDPSSTLPSELTMLEKQVKRATRSIDGGSTAETQIIHGQGDVHQIIHDAIIEIPSEPREPTAARREKENHGSNETTRVSVSLLHRIIEELETETKISTTVPADSRDVADEEERRIREEREEELIGTIESVEETERVVSTSDDDQLESTNGTSNLAGEEREASSAVNSSSAVENPRSMEFSVEEIPLPGSSSGNNAAIPGAERVADAKEMARTSGKKKKGLRSRMRKLVRAAFGWRKN